MIRLLFFAPYPEMKERLERVLRAHPEAARLEATIALNTVDQTPEVEEGRFDVVIARGYTALKIQKLYPAQPFVELSISGYDIVQAIARCTEQYHPKKIAICGFFSELYEVEEIARLFHVEAKVYLTKSHTELDATLRSAKNSGCEAVIGGYFIAQAAKTLGMHATVIRAGEDNLLHAVNAAISMADSMRAERVRAETYKTIIYASRDGVLFVDDQGVIQVRNHVVRDMLGGNVSLLYRPLSEKLPFLCQTYRRVLKTGQAEQNELHKLGGGRLTVACSFSPVIVHQSVSGVVITVSDITVIQELEGQIRRKLSSKGLYAKYTFDDILHKSKVMDETIRIAKRYAATSSNIIIVGETGTGKELFAQSIHNASPRRRGPFVAVNCAALPENLLESELFGYVEGAFTGSGKGGKIGLFEQAHNGTIFLDEIGEISLSMQIKLLRVLQEHEIRRLGDDKVVSVSVRVITATNKNLREMVRQGLFRHDLLYRLDVLRVFLPPLRERAGDAALLFQNQLRQLAQENNMPAPQIEKGALAALHGYPFEGNVRELCNLAERVFVRCENNCVACGDVQKALHIEDVPVPRLIPEKKPGPVISAGGSDAGEEELIRRALEQSGYNRSRAAVLLGCDRTTLWRKMQKYPNLCKK
ncbi:MAG: AAA family ATPase [Ruminococcaceae bacterium]|nr:AAA family ATPase [Oscillospiraceae bacterium]